MVQQPRFAPDSGTEADHFAVAADHAMTGDDNRDVVFGDFRQFILKIAKKLQLGLTMSILV
jgi:hypothetical protein